ncbi:MAG: hypothetical protein ABI615_11320 [Chthoniobacterales bacterium]
MDRFLFVLVAVLLLPAAGFAQDPSPKASSPAKSEVLPPPPPPPPGDFKPPNAPNLPPRMREWYEKMPETERGKFLENFRKWQQMGDDEKRHFRERAVMERQRIQAAIDAAVQKSGLTLDKDQREAFERRYMQERRKIEQTLRKELQSKRDLLLEGVIVNLKNEFSSSSKKAAATPSPATSPATP